MMIIFVLILINPVFNVLLRGSGDVHILKSGMLKEKRVSPNENSLNNNKIDSKYENVEIIKRDNLWDKSPEYVKQEKKEEMKTATLLNNSSEPVEGLTERPNFLSAVIRSHPTSVSTPINVIGGPSYDLDSISIKI